MKNPVMAGWEKWLLMTVIILGLSAIVVYFNFRVFGWLDGAPYIAVIFLIALTSLLITRHVRRYPVTTSFVVAAFIYEVLLTATLATNATYSLSVMREMSIAGQGEAVLSANLETATKFKSDRAQRLALSLVSEQAPAASRTAVFAAKERDLFRIMIAELLLVGIAIFSLIGLSIFGDRDQNGIPDFLESSQHDRQDITGIAPSGVAALALRHSAPRRSPAPLVDGTNRPQ